MPESYQLEASVTSKLKSHVTAKEQKKESAPEIIEVPAPAKDKCDCNCDCE